jgi:nephrocystin-3
VYEDNGNYKRAYEFFHKNYQIQLEVLGPEHVRTVRAKNILNEPMYRRIALELGQEVPL